MKNMVMEWRMIEMENNIIFYGERGYIDALVLDLHSDLNLTKKFLSSIHFCGEKIPSWIQDLNDAVFFIEPSLAEFGDPDWLMRCNCLNGEKHLIFIEAKTVPYENCAISISDLSKCIEEYKKSRKSGVSVKSISVNSRINTQLTLKYRFSRALINRKKKSPVVEGPIWKVYYEKSLDFLNQSRKLEKDLNVKFCDDYLMNISDFWFVGLTNDSISIEPYKNENTRPFIYNEQGDLFWNDLKDHFGIITYNDLDNLLKTGTNYNNAKKYFDVKNK